jgi:hypothetical protein
MFVSRRLLGEQEEEMAPQKGGVDDDVVEDVLETQHIKQSPVTESPISSLFLHNVLVALFFLLLLIIVLFDDVLLSYLGIGIHVLLST